MPREAKPEWVDGCGNCRDLELRWRDAGADRSALADIRILTARHRHADHRATLGTTPLAVGAHPRQAVDE